MNLLGDFHFIRPAWFVLAPIVVWVWWLGRRSQDPLRGWRTVMNRELLDALTVGRQGRNQLRASARFAKPAPVGRWNRAEITGSLITDVGRIANPSHFWRGTTLLSGWLLAVVAVAGPTWRPEPSPFADDPVPVMLVLKAGETMELSDLVPSRMERARLKIADVASERKGQPLGLIVYAGSAHLVLPPTRDTEVVATMAEEITPAIMPRAGDDLAGAIELAARTLGDGGGSIVVIADTVSQVSESELAEVRAKRRVPVFFLAVARADTPEADAIQSAASALGAGVTYITPDLADVRSLVKKTAKAPVAIAAAGEETHWAEMGWWLVPVVALLSLSGFRRVRNTAPKEMVE